EQLKAKLSSLKLGDQKAQRAVMKLFSGADQFTIDKNGRVNLSERLYQQTGISKEVVLVGGVDKFHLWEPERYEAYISADDDEGDLSDVLNELGL
ncbi:MAG: division/cell wall cluster transcriptional repressor MraZ, partial [Puniceicoccales bacterium]